MLIKKGEGSDDVDDGTYQQDVPVKWGPSLDDYNPSSEASGEYYT